MSDDVIQMIIDKLNTIESKIDKIIEHDTKQDVKIGEHSVQLKTQWWFISGVAMSIIVIALKAWGVL